MVLLMATTTIFGSNLSLLATITTKLIMSLTVLIMTVIGRLRDVWEIARLILD